MTSYQIPPPSANFSFPPNNDDQLQFNYLDSFVTSWVTPESSEDPAFLSLYYWNSSTPEEPWRSKFNKSVPLNGTTTVPLDYVKSDGLGQLNLDYVDPIGSHRRITGAIFHIGRDDTQPKAMTWNRNALSPSTTSSTSQTTSSPTPSIPTTMPSSSTTLPPLAANTISAPTADPSPVTHHSSPFGILLAGIILGTLLALLAAILSIGFFVRRRRQKILAEQRARKSSRRRSTGPRLVYIKGGLHEMDAAVADKETGVEDGRWELDGNGRKT